MKCMRTWRVSLSHLLQYRINCYDLYGYNYEFVDLGLMKCFRTAEVEADSEVEGSRHAEGLGLARVYVPGLS